MTNPNNNKNFNDEALKINRKLKKELDSLKSLIQDADANTKISEVFKKHLVH